ncbi:MAG TPA: amino acid permease [Bacteroidales bacterium]|nr:amino acid permease [Bacteroidales bacterium]
MAHKPKPQGSLQQSLYLGTTILLVVSSIIGSGVYKKVAPMSSDLLSPTLVLICWVLAGVISLFGALSNAEIASMLADAGGEYVYFKRIYGRFMAFIYGWSVFTVIKSAAIASIAYLFTHSLNAVFPFPRLSASWEQIEILGAFKPFENLGVKLFTILLILVLTFLNTRGLKGVSFLSKSITKLVLGGLALIVISGLFFSNGSMSNITTSSVHYVHRQWYDFDLWKAIFGAMLSAFWAYEGWNSVGFIGSEIRNPKKNIPLAFLGGMTIVMAIYLLVNFTYLYVLPVDSLANVYTSQNSIAAVEVVRSFANQLGVALLTGLILITALGCTNSTILMPPRIYYAMAKDGLFFQHAADIHPKYNTPNYALWIQALWASMLVMSGSFDQLTDMLVFAAFFFYGATALGVFVMRIREPERERSYKVWGYPVVPALFVLFCVSLVIITFFTNPREAIVGIILMLTGVPFYLFWNKRSKK